MGNKKILTKLKQLKNDNYSLAYIAAVNKLKQTVIYEWQTAGRPQVWFFEANVSDSVIALEAADQLSDKFCGVTFWVRFV